MGTLEPLLRRAQRAAEHDREDRKERPRVMSTDPRFGALFAAARKRGYHVQPVEPEGPYEIRRNHRTEYTGEFEEALDWLDGIPV
jgi:hypothetical protein